MRFKIDINHFIYKFISLCMAFCLLKANASTYVFEDKELEEIFTDVTFSVPPREIKFRNMISVKNGDIEVHFRNVDHLKRIIKRFPLINADNVYYIYNPNFESRHCMKSTNNGQLVQDKFIHIIADQPMIIEGGREKIIPYEVILSDKIILLRFLPKIQRFLTFDRKSEFYERKDLIDLIENFDVNLFTLRTYEAFNLPRTDYLESEYSSNPNTMLENIFPEAKIISNKNINIDILFYLNSESTLFFISPHKEGIQTLNSQFPSLKKSINLIDPRKKHAGVYSKDPIYLRKGYRISTDGHLCVLGKIIKLENIFEFFLKETLWNVGKISTHSLYIESKKIYNLIFKDFFRFIKPEGMPDIIYDAILNYLQNIPSPH